MRSFLQSDQAGREDRTGPPFPNIEHEFIVATDASEARIGFMLFQPADNNQIDVIAFGGRGYTDHERKYSVFKKKLLAVIWALRKNDTLLRGIRFTIQTDHRALIYILIMPTKMSIIDSWLDEILDYQFDIIHVP